MSGITLDISSKFYSQTKGQIKIVNTCLESYLRCYDLDKKTQWMKQLLLAEWSYNSTYHTSTKMSPFEVIYRYTSPSISYFLQDKSKVHAIELQMEKTRNFNNSQVKPSNSAKQEANQHVNEEQFEKIDWVFLRLQPYKQFIFKQKKKKNIATKFNGNLQDYSQDWTSGISVRFVFPHSQDVYCLKKGFEINYASANKTSKIV